MFQRLDQIKDLPESQTTLKLQRLDAQTLYGVYRCIFYDPFRTSTQKAKRFNSTEDMSVLQLILWFILMSNTRTQNQNKV